MFKKGFEKTASVKMPKLLSQATKTMDVKAPGYSKKSISSMWRRRQFVNSRK